MEFSNYAKNIEQATRREGPAFSERVEGGGSALAYFENMRNILIEYFANPTNPEAVAESLRGLKVATTRPVPEIKRELREEEWQRQPATPTYDMYESLNRGGRIKAAKYLGAGPSDKEYLDAIGIDNVPPYLQPLVKALVGIGPPYEFAPEDVAQKDAWPLVNDESVLIGTSLGCMIPRMMRDENDRAVQVDAVSRLYNEYTDIKEFFYRHVVPTLRTAFLENERSLLDAVQNPDDPAYTSLQESAGNAATLNDMENEVPISNWVWSSAAPTESAMAMEILRMQIVARLDSQKKREAVNKLFTFNAFLAMKTELDKYMPFLLNLAKAIFGFEFRFDFSASRMGRPGDEEALSASDIPPRAELDAEYLSRINPAYIQRTPTKTGENSEPKSLASQFALDKESFIATLRTPTDFDADLPEITSPEGNNEFLLDTNVPVVIRSDKSDKTHLNLQIKDNYNAAPDNTIVVFPVVVRTKNGIVLRDQYSEPSLVYAEKGSNVPGQLTKFIQGTTLAVINFLADKVGKEIQSNVEVDVEKGKGTATENVKIEGTPEVKTGVEERKEGELEKIDSLDLSKTTVRKGQQWKSAYANRFLEWLAEKTELAEQDLNVPKAGKGIWKKTETITENRKLHKTYLDGLNKLLEPKGFKLEQNENVLTLYKLPPETASTRSEFTLSDFFF